MFANRFVRNVARMNGVRNASTFKLKTASDVWLGDVGAYPVMGLMVFVLSMATAAGVYITTNTGDMRLAKSSRKTLFRGEYFGQDA